MHRNFGESFHLYTPCSSKYHRSIASFTWHMVLDTVCSSKYHRSIASFTWHMVLDTLCFSKYHRSIASFTWQMVLDTLCSSKYHRSIASFTWQMVLGTPCSSKYHRSIASFTWQILIWNCKLLIFYNYLSSYPHLHIPNNYSPSHHKLMFSIIFQHDPLARKDYLPLRAKLLAAKYGSPFSDQGYVFFGVIIQRNRSGGYLMII